MFAVQVSDFGPVENLTLAEVITPGIGAHDVLIAVAAAGVNYPDVMMVEGTYQNLPTCPFTPGKEAAGTVVEVGSAVRDLRVGDRVLAMVEDGAFAEYLAVPREKVVRIPDRLSFDEAAAFGMVYSTAYLALVRRAHLRAGESVLVTGAGGGVGSAAVQIAKALGAHVVAVADRPEKAELAKAQGADTVITVPTPALRDRVLEATGGRGVDVTVDTVGGDVFDEALRATAWEGRLVVVGFASGRQNPIKPGRILVRNIAVLGLQSSDYHHRDPEGMQRVFEDLLALYEAGKLTVPIDGRYPLTAVSSALERMRSGQVTGKIVLTTTSGRSAANEGEES